MSPSSDPLPIEHLTRLENFGHSLTRPAYLYSPANSEELAQLFELAAEQDLSVGLRGSGRSYGDASLNSGEIVLNLSGMNRVLGWNAQKGIIKVEPGVTIEQLWKHVLGDGWWPPVVPGTMFPTLGGCLAANIHGKNNWLAGTLGEHVLEFEARLPNGEQVKCSPEHNGQLFHAMIGGMGLLGVFTSITLQLKQVNSGDLRVQAWAEPDLAGMLAAVDGNKTADYVVGWIDCTVPGPALGRGQIHRGDYLKPGEDADPTRSLRIDHHELPPRLFGVVPAAWLPPIMRLFTNNLGVRLINTGRYFTSRTIGHRRSYLQSLGEFNFLLDYIPGWERMYGRGGLIQHQSFVPKASAEKAFRQILELCQQRGLPSYLGVLKRHRPDKFLLSHAVDGFSLALDFRVTERNRGRLQALAEEIDQIVLAAGGRFYFAKDSTLNAERTRRYLGDEVLRKLTEIKNKVDPQLRLQSDLWRRCLEG